MDKSGTVLSWPDHSASKTASGMCLKPGEGNGKSPLVDIVSSLERKVQEMCSYASFFS